MISVTKQRRAAAPPSPTGTPAIMDPPDRLFGRPEDDGKKRWSAARYFARSLRMLSHWNSAPSMVSTGTRSFRPWAKSSDDFMKAPETP
jgi:hypothetical protein